MKIKNEKGGIHQYSFLLPVVRFRTSTISPGTSGLASITQFPLLFISSDLWPIVSIILLLLISFLWYQNRMLLKRLGNGEGTQTQYKKGIAEDEALLIKENVDLKQQIQLKNKEITKKSKKLLNNEKVLESIRKLAIESLREKEAQKRNRNLTTIKRIVDNHLRKEKDNFSLVFDENNDLFYKLLKEKHPSLTLNNLRLAAYVKAGFTSKEIAEIQNLLPSSIIVNRSRLRKKLRLKSSQDLYDYLSQYE